MTRGRFAFKRRFDNVDVLAGAPLPLVARVAYEHMCICVCVYIYIYIYMCSIEVSISKYMQAHVSVRCTLRLTVPKQCLHFRGSHLAGVVYLIVPLMPLGLNCLVPWL